MINYSINHKVEAVSWTGPDLNMEKIQEHQEHLKLNPDLKYPNKIVLDSKTICLWPTESA